MSKYITVTSEIGKIKKPTTKNTVKYEAVRRIPEL